MSMWTRCGEFLAQRVLASAPALWGKLPSHGDYVRYRATAAQAHAWGEWVEQHWAHTAVRSREDVSAPTPSRRQRREGPSPWISTQAKPVQPRLQDLPVAFVMPPGAMPFAKRQYVQGVWVPSMDRSGRACPLVIYQTVSKPWLTRTTLADTEQGRHAGRPQHWLYWLARLGVQVQGGAHDFNRICQSLDALWALQRPGWRALGGEGPVEASSQEHLACLLELSRLAEHDATQGWRGVAQLPWPHWPQSLLQSEHPQAAYWQQDARGAYVNAALSLDELWKSQT